MRIILSIERAPRSCALAALFVLGAVAACGTGDDSSAPRGDCPVAPVSVVVTVDQWGDIVERLGGDCADVTTIIKGSATDPHGYEPTTGDTAEFEDAELVVRNGLDYDHWAESATDALDVEPAIVDAGEVVGLDEGDNPHVWYGPEYVHDVAAAVTAELQRLEPSAATYFEDRLTAWTESMQPYDDQIAAIRAVSAGKSYGATEPVFDHMADALGLTDATPSGYQDAARNESDPAPGDIEEFESELRDRAVTLLVFNTQTEGATPDQLRDVALDVDLPVVDVTETVPPGADGFVDWQVSQLEALATALGA